MKQLICGSLNGMRIRQSLPRPYISWAAQWQGLEFQDWGAIPGLGLLLTAERWIKGMRGRRLWWEMPVEESQAAGSKAILLSHVKPVEPSPWPLSPTHQHWEPNNRGWPIKHLMH